MSVWELGMPIHGAVRVTFGQGPAMVLTLVCPQWGSSAALCSL